MNSGSGSYLKQLQMLHGAFCAGVVMFLGISAFLVYQDGPLGEAASLVMPLTMAAIVLVVSGLLAHAILTSRMIAKARWQSDVTGKLNAYRAAFIVGMALLEGPALFSIVAYLLTGVSALLILLVVPLVRMAMMRPSREKVVEALSLQWNEVDAL